LHPPISNFAYPNFTALSMNMLQYNMILQELAFNTNFYNVSLKMVFRSIKKKNSAVQHSHTVLMKVCRCGRYRQLNSVLPPYHILKSLKNNIKRQSVLKYF